MSEPPPSRRGDLASFAVIHRNDQLFDLCNPGFWYRRTPRGYQFLVYQNLDTDTSEHGFEPGYYTWVEGDTWRRSDRWGHLGERVRYHAARDLASVRRESTKGSGGVCYGTYRDAALPEQVPQGPRGSK